MIGEYFVRYRIIITVFKIVSEVFSIGNDIHSGQFFEILIIEQNKRLIRKTDSFVVKEREESIQINRISKPCQRTG